MQQHKTTQAQSELMALLADAPPGIADQLRLGQLLLEVNEPEHAVDVDNAILAKDRESADAWLQKGQALLALNRYVDAEHALATAVEQNPNLGDARRQLDILREALRLDTSLRGLSRADRANRAVESFHAAWNRLNDCATQQGVSLTNPATTTAATPASQTKAVPAATPPDSLQLLYSSGLQKQAAANEKALREDPDALDAAMQYVFEVERTTAPICPTMRLTDQALLLLAHHEAK
jgi:tetratricopeptide (TPR) repeat protein